MKDSLFFELFLMATGVLWFSDIFVRFRDLRTSPWGSTCKLWFVRATPLSTRLPLLQINHGSLSWSWWTLPKLFKTCYFWLICHTCSSFWCKISSFVLVPYILPILIFVAGFAYFNNKHVKKFCGDSLMTDKTNCKSRPCQQVLLLPTEATMASNCPWSTLQKESKDTKNNMFLWYFLAEKGDFSGSSVEWFWKSTLENYFFWNLCAEKVPSPSWWETVSLSSLEKV